MRLTRLTLRYLGAMLLALPVTCAAPGDGLYSGGVEPSPASRVNPAEPGFVNDGNHSR